MSVEEIVGVAGTGTVVGPNSQIRGFDKIRRQRYRSPILTYALSPEFVKFAMEDRWVAGICASASSIGSYDLGKSPSKALIVHENPESFFFGTHNFLARETNVYSRSKQTISVGKDCKIHTTAHLEPGAVIGDAVTIGPQCYVGSSARIGSGSTLMARSLVGIDSLEIKEIDNVRQPVEHIGGVRIGKGVVVGANATISKALFHGYTSISNGTSLGEYCHISHGVQVGENCFLAAGVLTGGYTVIGNTVSIGIGAKLKQFVNVGDSAKISMGSVVVEDVPAKTSVSGFYAVESKRWAASQFVRSR